MSGRDPSNLGADSDDRTVRARQDWDRMAATYDRGAGLERLLTGDSRARLCARAQGRTLEVAIGTGLNLGMYDAGVVLTGVDLSGGMLAVAARRAAATGARVGLVQADAQRLPFDGASFDSVVCTMALCAVPDQSAVVAEFHRVLRPGGRLLLLDHVEYARVPMRWVERWRTRRHGRRRRPLDVVADAGFAIERHDPLRFGFVDWVVARRPS
ncbi:MAG: class I SAM-dependent methyltransferase [Jiangellaceae bacterium]